MAKESNPNDLVFYIKGFHPLDAFGQEVRRPLAGGRCLNDQVLYIKGFHPLDTFAKRSGDLWQVGVV